MLSFSQILWQGQVTEGGFDIHPPEKEIKRKLEVQREFRNEKGETIVKAALGEVITARIKIRTIEPKGCHNVAIVDLLPAGFEVVLDSVGRGAPGQRRR